MTQELQLDQKYRPTSIKDMILSKDIKKALLNHVKKGTVPHLLFHSTQPGTGKTTASRALVNDLGLDPTTDYLFLKGDNVNVGYIREYLIPFCSSASPSGKKRVVIIDEYDRPTLGEAQKMMRATVDEYSEQVSFIITANNPSNIHEALRNRMHTYNFGVYPTEEIKDIEKQCFNRLKEICELENIKVEEPKILALIARLNVPYFRTCLVELAKYAYANDFVLDAGLLKELIERRNTSKEIVNLIKSDNFNVDKVRAISKKESHNFGGYVDMLYTDIMPHITDVSQSFLIEIIGEANKTAGICGNIEFHLFYMIYQLQKTLVWK